MGIEQANEALEAGLSEASTSATPAQSTGQSVSTEPVDLDVVTKVKWEGKEYTPTDFRKMMMRQEDYTRKTQSLSETQKYYNALQYDFVAVRENPKLAQEFLKMYPETFHKYLDAVMPKDWKTGAQEEKGNLPPEIDARLSRFENYIREQEVSAEEAKIDNLTSKLSQKYPEAIEDVVLARAQAFVESGRNLSQEDWDKLYKTSHDFMVKKMTEKQNNNFNAQKNANQKGRGIGPGGGTPGQAPRRLSFNEATEAAIKDLKG